MSVGLRIGIEQYLVRIEAVATIVEVMSAIHAVGVVGTRPQAANVTVPIVGGPVSA
jgi:hypothetical protein